MAREPLTGQDIGRYGFPKETTACPGCGKQYGTKAKGKKPGGCLNCEECLACCGCEAPNHVGLEAIIQQVTDKA